MAWVAWLAPQEIPSPAPSIGSFVLISMCRVTGEIEREMAVRTPSQLYHQGDVTILVHQVHNLALIRLPIDNSGKMIYASATLPVMLPKLSCQFFDDKVLPCRDSLYAGNCEVLEEACQSQEPQQLDCGESDSLEAWSF
jgi:hypothetical protein